MAYHPELQHAVAEMALAFDPIGPHLDRVAEDWSNGVDHGADLAGEDRLGQAPRGRGLLADRRHWRWRYPAVPACSAANELERLFRDARCGRFHPGQYVPDARDRRQDRARHRPRRAASLGVSGR